MKQSMWWILPSLLVAALSCSRMQDLSSGNSDEYGFCSVAPQALCKNVATGNTLPAGLQTTVAQLSIGAWDTTVAAAFSDHHMTINRVPVGTGTVTLLCVDALGDTVYRGTQTLNLSKGVTAAPAIILSPTDPHGLVLIIISPAPDLRINADNIMINGYVEAPAGIMSLTVKGQNVSINGTSFSATVALDTGSNIIPVILQDNSGGVKGKSITVVRDVNAQDITPPQIIIQQPVFQNDTATVSGTTCQMSGTAVDASKIIYFAVSGSQIILDNSNNWLKTVSLNNGPNRVFLEARDEHNNIQYDTVIVVYNPSVVDSIPPSLTVSEPQNNAVVSIYQANVIGSATDASGIKSVSVKVNSGSPIQATLVNGKDFSLTVPLDTTATPDTNTIQVTAIDNHDIRSSVTRIIVYNKTAIDSSKPNIQIQVPLDGITVSLPSVGIRGTASDAGSGIKDVVITMPDTTIMATLNGTLWDATVILKTTGPNAIRVTASDKASPSNTNTVTITVKYNPAAVDSSGPVIQVLQPGDNDTISSPQVVISGTVQDQSKIRTMTIDGQVIQPKSGGQWSTSNNWEYFYTFTQPGGKVFTIIAADSTAAANATTVSFHLIYKPSSANRPPNKPNTPIPSLGQVTDPTVNLQWSGGDPDGQSVSYTIYLDTSANLAAVIKQQQTAPSLSLGRLEFGRTYFWKVIASDGLLQDTSPIWSFTVRNPLLSGVALDTMVGVTDSSLSFRWTQTRDLDFERYEIRMAHTTPVTVTDSLFATITLRQDTTYTVTSLPENSLWYAKVLACAGRFQAIGNEIITKTEYKFPDPVAVTILDSTAISIRLSWTRSNARFFDRYEVAHSSVNDPSTATMDTTIRDTNKVAYQIQGLSPSTKYYVWVYVWNGISGRISTVASATTLPPPNNPPTIPNNPNPPDSANGLDTTCTVSWWGGNDPDAGDAVTFDVYRGIQPDTLVRIIQSLQANTCDLYNLNFNTTYYWQIRAIDNHGAETPGPVWRFTTRPKWTVVPGTPALPYSPGMTQASLGFTLDPSKEYAPVVGFPEGPSFFPTVMRYDVGTGTWNALGSHMFYQSPAGYIDLAAASNGDIFISNSDPASSIYYQVYKLPSGSSSWLNYNANNIQNTWRMGKFQYSVPIAVLINGMPAICSRPAYAGADGMFSYNDGSQWQQDMRTVTTFQDTAYSLDLAYDGTNTWAAFTNSAGESHLAYNNGANLSDMGSLPNSETNFAGSSPYMSLAVDNTYGIYAAYRMDASTQGHLTVRKNTGKDSWLDVGITDASGAPVRDISLAMNRGGVLYVAYVEDRSPNYMVVVRKFDGSNWINVGNPADCTFDDSQSSVMNMHLGIDSSTGADKIYIAYLSYSTLTGLYTIHVYKFGN